MDNYKPDHTPTYVFAAIALLVAIGMPVALLRMAGVF